MDKQFAVAVILMILGFGLMQAGPEDAFVSGLGAGTVAIAGLWIAVRIAKDVRRRPRAGA